MKFTSVRDALSRLALACAGVRAAPKPQHTTKLSTPAIGDINVEWKKTFTRRVEERTWGKLKVELCPGSQLGPMALTGCF